MYKLTYESEDEVETGGAFPKPTPRKGQENVEDEQVIYDRSSSPEDQSKDELNRHDTTKSAIASAYGASNGSKQKKDWDRNFYALFRDIKDSKDKDPKNQKSFSSAMGFKECLLIIYLAILSIGIIALAVFLQSWTQKYHGLQDRVNYLEERVNLINLEMNQPKTGVSVGPVASASLVAESAGMSSGQVQAIPDPPPDDHHEIPDPPSDIHVQPPYVNPHLSPPKPRLSGGSGCCSSLKRDVKDLSKRLDSHVESGLKVKVQTLSSRLSGVENAIKNLELTALVLKTREQESNGMAALALQEASMNTKTDEQSNRDVAFEAFQANSSIKIDPTVELYAVFGDATKSKTLFYNYEMINRKVDMDPSTGVFVAPTSGAYYFQVSFCTMGTGVFFETKLALMRNQVAVRELKAPFVTTIDDVINAGSIGKGVKSNRGQQDNKIRRHTFSVVSDLQAGDKVKVVLLSGDVVEITGSNRVVSSCTSFSGFKI